MKDKIQKVEIVKPKEPLKVEMDHKMPKYLPSISLDEDDLPEIKSWKVGGKYKLEVEVEQTSISKDEEFDGPVIGQTGERESKRRPIRARFKILNVKALNGGSRSIPKKDKMDAIKKKLEAY